MAAANKLEKLIHVEKVTGSNPHRGMGRVGGESKRAKLSSVTNVLLSKALNLQLVIGAAQ